MNTPEAVHAHAQSADTDESVHAGRGAHIQLVKLELSERTLSVIAIMLASLAVGLVILAIVLGQLSERESKLAREDIRIMQTKMIEHGINLDEHSTEKVHQ